MPAWLSLCCVLIVLCCYKCANTRRKAASCRWTTNSIYWIFFSLTGGIMLHTLERACVPSRGLIHYLLLTRGKSPGFLYLLVRSNGRNGVLARSRSSPGVSGSRRAKPSPLILNENTLCLCTHPRLSINHVKHQHCVPAYC